MFQAVSELEAFLFAGNATFTIESTKSGAHFTYKVSAVKNSDSKWFVGVLNGPNNESDYAYIGLIDSNHFGQRRFRQTAKSRFGADAPSVKVFTWFFGTLQNNAERVFEQAHVHHEGRCGRCNRTLTVPESIERGIGPECFGKLAA